MYPKKSILPIRSNGLPARTTLAVGLTGLLALLVLGFAACSKPKFTHGDGLALSLVERSQEFSVAGDDNAAFNLLKAGIKEFPTSFELRKEYAGAAARTERLALAIEAFEALLASQPDNWQVAQQLAWTSLSGGFLDHASGPIKALTTRSGASAFDFTLASQLAFEQGDLKAAQAWAQKAISKAPQDPESAYQLARVLVALESADARAALMLTLELDPGQTQARFALGTLQLQAGESEAGQNNLDLRKEIHHLSTHRFGQKGAKQRIALARKLGKKLPTWSRPSLEVARAQLELGQPKKAQKTLALAAKLAPDHLDRLELNYAAALARNQPGVAKKWLSAWKQSSRRKASTE